MELRLLGTPELRMGEVCLDLGGPRQRIVLCMLAFNANRVVSVDQLLTSVWGETPPSTARGQIQMCISRLRKLFADAGRLDAILTRSPGYLLRVKPGELDVDLFHARVAAGREHAAAGRTVAAVEELRAALALWRGAAAAGVPSEVVQRETTLLEGRRHEVLEERVRLDLALGRHDQLVGELRAMVDEQPLRERLHAFLMLALYRTGRQAEALAAARQARAILAEEIGVAPGRELQDLERGILIHDPALDLHQPAPVVHEALAIPPPRPAVPNQLPASIADFTGREEQLSQIQRILSTLDNNYAVRIVAICGRGGVGKSSLAVRAAHQLADQYPDGLLYADLRASENDGDPEWALARFLGSLGLSGAAMPEGLAERAELYRSMLAPRRMLVVLDGAVDEGQVLPLLPGSPNCAVIITSRMRLGGLPGTHWIPLDVFDADQSVRILMRIVGADRVEAEPGACAELVRLCDGLPLALRIAGARLASRPHWRVEDLVHRLRDESRRLDEFVYRGLQLRSNIALTYRGLSDRAQRLFRLFALVDAPHFPGWAAVALLDADVTEADEVLEQLVDAQVLSPMTADSAERMGRYRLHGLIRAYARECLAQQESGAERAAALERYLGGWLAVMEEVHFRDRGPWSAPLRGSAPRWSPLGTPLSEHLGDGVLNWETVHPALVAAIRQAGGAGLAELCWELLIAAMPMFEAGGHFDDWQETAQLALRVTEKAGDLRGSAAAWYSLGVLHTTQRRRDEARNAFDSALALLVELGDRPAQELVLSSVAFLGGRPYGRFVPAEGRVPLPPSSACREAASTCG